MWRKCVPCVQINAPGCLRCQKTFRNGDPEIKQIRAWPQESPFLCFPAPLKDAEMQVSRWQSSGSKTNPVAGSKNVRSQSNEQWSGAGGNGPIFTPFATKFSSCLTFFNSLSSRKTPTIEPRKTHREWNVSSSKQTRKLAQRRIDFYLICWPFPWVPSRTIADALRTSKLTNFDTF